MAKLKSSVRSGAGDLLIAVKSVLSEVWNKRKKSVRHIKEWSMKHVVSG